MKFVGEKKSKIEFTSVDMFKQLISFTNNVMKMKKNGYNGYKYSLQATPKNENDKNKKVEDLENPIEILIKIEINHLDWKSIKEGESPETF